MKARWEIENESIEFALSNESYISYREWSEPFVL